MFARLRILGMAASVSLGGLGCTTCYPRALEKSLSPIEECSTIAPQRNRVHTFIVNGDDPLGIGSLPQLPGRLHDNGFAMVHVGQVFHGGAFETEIRRLMRCEPETRFILVGGGFGAVTVDCIARRLSVDGIRPDGLVLVAPLYLDSGAAELPGVRQVVINPRSPVPEDVGEVYHAPGVTRFGLPGHPVVESTVLDMLRASAAQVVLVETPTAVLPLLDDPAPIPNYVPDEPPAEPRKQPVPGELVGRPK